MLGAEEFGFATTPLIATGLRDDAGLPPEHMPGRGRNAGPASCASGLTGEPGARQSTSCASWRREVRELMAELGFRASATRWWGGAELPSRCKPGRGPPERRWTLDFGRILEADRAGVEREARRSASRRSTAYERGASTPRRSRRVSAAPALGRGSSRSPGRCRSGTWNRARRDAARERGDRAPVWGAAGLPDGTIAPAVSRARPGRASARSYPHGLTL